MLCTPIFVRRRSTRRRAKKAEKPKKARAESEIPTTAIGESIEGPGGGGGIDGGGGTSGGAGGGGGAFLQHPSHVVPQLSHLRGYVSQDTRP